MFNFLSKLTKRAFYQGAKKTGANRDFWNANSPFEDTAVNERDTLRARARWLSANNPIMGNIDNSYVTNVVGKGIKLQANTGDTDLDDKIDKRFKAWSKRCDLTEELNFFDIQKMIFSNRMIDGEIFIYKKITKDGLKLQLLEADAIDDSEGENNGITRNANGKPIYYHFLDKDNNKIKIKAKHIINYFKKERPTQFRGVSEYKRAIIDIKNFSSFQSSTVQNARANAEIAYTIETERENGSFNAIQDNGEEIHDINGLMVYYLKAGEKINKHGNDMGKGFDEFITNSVRMIASARSISYELAFKDYSKVNFASSRASIIQDNKKFDDEQSHLSSYFLDNVFQSWLEVEVLRNGLISPVEYFNNKDDYINPKWSFPRRIWVDPKKEIDAIEKEIKLNLTTETDVASQMGLDYEDILAKKQKELELKKKYGIKTDEEIDLNLVLAKSANQNGEKNETEN